MRTTFSAKVTRSFKFRKIRKYKCSKEVYDFLEFVKICILCCTEQEEENSLFVDLFESAMQIAKKDKKKEVDITSIIKLFEEPIKRFKAQKVTNIEELKKTAYHELGHYVVFKELCNQQVKVMNVSIIPYHELGGINITLNENEAYTKESAVNYIAAQLAGDISTELFCKQRDSGIEGDLACATELCWEILLGTRMRPKGKFLKERGSYIVDGVIRLDILSEAQKNELSKQTDKMLKKAERIARKALRKNKKKILELAEILLERGALTGEQIDALYEGRIKKCELPKALISRIK